MANLLLDTLNEHQQQAVLHPDGPAIVLVQAQEKHAS
jgi:superfamily I DNA/RNA helicase